MSFLTAGYGNVYRTYPQVPLQTQTPFDPSRTSFWPRLAQVGPPPVPLPKLGNWSAGQYLRYWPLVETAQRLKLIRVGDPPVRFPPIGLWTVGQYPPYWPLIETAQRLKLIAVGNPPVLFRLPPQPFFAPPPPFFQPKPAPIIPVLVIPPSFPPPWIANWAAYQQGPLSRAFFQILPTLPAGDPPALIGRLQQPFFGPLLSNAFFQTLRLLPPSVAPPLPPPPAPTGVQYLVWPPYKEKKPKSHPAAEVLPAIGELYKQIPPHLLGELEAEDEEEMVMLLKVYLMYLRGL